MKTIVRLFALMLFPVLFAACSANGQPEIPIERMRTAFSEVPDVPLAVYWYWISDNISREGVVRDLEAMKAAGINRAFIGNIGLDDVPYGEHKVMSDGWWKILHTALRTAGELGIEIGIFNSPGWSQSGGPWIEPEESMRYLASSEMTVRGPSRISADLPAVANGVQPVGVIAYPVQDGTWSRTWDMRKTGGQNAELDMEIPGGCTVRTISIQTDRPVMTDARLYRKQGGEYVLEKNIHIDRSNPSLNVGFVALPPVVVAVPETASSGFRLVFDPPGDAAFQVTLTSLPLVERYPEKTLAKMFQTPLPLWHDYLWEPQPEASDASLAVDPERVRELTGLVSDGRLEWEVPPGDWKILNIMMCPTTVTNAPASPEGIGLEVDKMSRMHVASHFDAFIGEILRRIPAADRRTFKVVVQDSYETGSQNWTDDMAQRFTEAYGYDPVPFLPVLYGTVVGSRDMSDRFLWDMRRLVADRIAYDYVGGLRDESHKHGLVTWLENYGHWGYPGEFLQYGGQSDEVGGEFWSEGSLGDIENRAASSCAHIYGKRRVWAESFTAGGNGFSRYPYRMKQRGDRFFTEGINSTLLHVYIHQPYEDRNPGMSAWFGNEFNRKNTWFRHMDVFTDYLKRVNFMLQQGRYIADAAYFIGEDAPKMTGVCDPELPAGYSFDYINGEVLMTKADVRDGKLVLDSGMEYSVLVLPRLGTMRPELLEKLEGMVKRGLVIVGPRPERSPSLAGYPASDDRVRSLASGLWKGVEPAGYARYGKGYVFGEANSLTDVFGTLSVAPDFTARGDGLHIGFIHRHTVDGDIYFVSNQQERRVAFDAAFRVGEGTPELWDALNGEVRVLPEFVSDGSATTLPLELEPFGSAFVVFRKPGKTAAAAGVNFPVGKTLTVIDGPWQVDFEGVSAPAGTVFDALSDWSESADPQLKYFSGTARYKTTFDMAEIPAGEHYVDLGNVMVTGRVRLNGENAGGVWTYPYRVNVSGLIKEGENTLEVEVANNWMNRLIGDLGLPEEERRTWTIVNPWNAGSALQSSGLLGPVSVVSFDYRLAERPR